MSKDINGLHGIELVRQLCLEFGPSGCEDRVREMIEHRVRDVADKVVIDRMGNLICKMSFGDGTNKKKIMISAHMDEVGFMIDHIRSDGMLTFGTVGGINSSVIAGRKITVEGKGGLISGVICSKAIHHKEKDERRKATPTEKLYMDVGATTKEEAQELLEIGSFATFDSEFFAFGKDGRTVKCKALDDRMGCAAMLEAMDSLRQEPPIGDVELYFCFTVREEIGYSGAEVAANLISPDMSIVLETTAISDLPETEAHRRVADVGEGGVISVADRATIYKRELVDYVLELAKRDGVKAQIKRYVSGGNDAGHIHKALAGIDTVAISVPTRYLHSPACVAYMDDYEAVRDLVLAIIKDQKEK